jgi:hypothetical protein
VLFAIVCIAFAVIRADDSIDAQVYTTLSNAHPCVRLTTTYNQVGCASRLLCGSVDWC